MKSIQCAEDVEGAVVPARSLEHLQSCASVVVLVLVIILSQQHFAVIDPMLIYFRQRTHREYISLHNGELLTQTLL